MDKEIIYIDFTSKISFFEFIQDEFKKTSIDLSVLKNENLGCPFFWITDGNYWLTLDGRSRFYNLLNRFDKIYNINSFTEEISLITL